MGYIDIMKWANFKRLFVTECDYGMLEYTNLTYVLLLIFIPFGLYLQWRYTYLFDGLLGLALFGWYMLWGAKSKDRRQAKFEQATRDRIEEDLKRWRKVRDQKLLEILENLKK